MWVATVDIMKAYESTSHQSLWKALEKMRCRITTHEVARWPKTKRIGICFGNFESDCLTDLRLAGGVLLISTSLVQLQKIMCNFKHSTKGQD